MERSLLCREVKEEGKCEKSIERKSKGKGIQTPKYDSYMISVEGVHKSVNFEMVLGITAGIP